MKKLELEGWQWKYIKFVMGLTNKELVSLIIFENRGWNTTNATWAYSCAVEELCSRLEKIGFLDASNTMLQEKENEQRTVGRDTKES
jgi:hypothetical protein